MKKRKIKVEKILLLLVFIIVILYFYIKNIGTDIKSTTLADISSNHNIVQLPPKYEIIKQDNNDKYSGIGQKTIENKDGYFTTFTTETNNYHFAYILYKSFDY